MMKYTALAVVFLVMCIGIGLRRGARVDSLRTAAVLAAAMVSAQFVLLMWQ